MPGALTVMANSGSINAVPATASHYLLTDILRGQMGFNGVVISDYQDVGALQTAYHVAADLPGAIAKAVNAGVDMSMQVFDAAKWQAAALQAVGSGAISQARIDEAVRRILTLKFKLGLFDQPCMRDASKPCVNADAANAAIEAGRPAALKASQESITLLRNNNNVLPLSAGKVVVTGPSADSMTNQLGGWSVSWQGVFGAGHVCCMGPPNQIPPGTTVLTGIQAANPDTVFAPDQASALAQAADASAYVVAVGEKAYAEGLGDNPAPALPADQQALIAALQATGKPVIVVVIAGRPVGLGPAANGRRRADGLPGRHRDRSGRRRRAVRKGQPERQAADQLAVGRGGGRRRFRRDRALSAGRSTEVLRPTPGHRVRPRATPTTRCIPFGFGLSYTTFTHTDLTVHRRLRRRDRYRQVHGDQHR